MRIAIASGKGGTGKTTFATNFAWALAAEGAPVAYLDCDVEEPNGHIFLRPDIEQQHRVTIPVPEVDLDKCTYCGLCGEACRFSAIVTVKQSLLTFPNLCHGCGGCMRACPEDAIREVPRATGVVEQGTSGNMVFVHGRLDVGEAMAPPVIRAVLERAPADHTIIIDAPPGTSCPVIASIQDADVVLLVTEPTPFGLNDLKLAVGMVRALGKPFAVAVNRAGVGDREVFAYCEGEGIPILFELADDRRIALAYSRGQLAVRALPELLPRLRNLLADLTRIAREQPVSTEQVVRPPLDPQPLPTIPSNRLTLAASPPPEQLVVLSGKGGTGKTSIVASLAVLADRPAMVDCDVDAADLHLVLEPVIQSQWPFSGGFEAEINRDDCINCLTCAELCRFDAITLSSGMIPTAEINPLACEGCGVCVDACPAKAIQLVPAENGEWFLSATRIGPLVHARMGIAAENTGKLVSLVRQEARAVATHQQRDLLLIDGSPGIGCPVIASVTGANFVLLVSEPTLSAIHDLKRVAELCRHFGVRAGVCINKADLNPEMAQEVIRAAGEMDLPVVGHIRYDPAVTEAQVQRKSVVELGDSPAAEDIRALWAQLERMVRSTTPTDEPSLEPVASAS